MKKTYVKPSINMEYFTLSQSIAAGCGSVPGGNTTGKPNHGDKTTCGWDMGNMVIWTEDNGGCDFEWGADDPWETVCYNNPNGGNSVFNS